MGQYAATKYALKALADSLREEVNAAGVRVLSVFPGSTASPMQAAVHAMNGQEYHPERLMRLRIASSDPGAQFAAPVQRSLILSLDLCGNLACDVAKPFWGASC